MQPRTSARWAPAALASLVILILLPTSAWSQAWTPRRGTGYTWLSYSNLDVGDHLFSIDVPKGAVPPSWQGQASNGADLGDIRAQSTLVGIGYGVTSSLAVDGDIAYVESRYRGPDPESSLDNGTYNRALQDVRVRVRYNVWARPLLVTPFIGLTVPSHDYEAIGHSAVGRNLKEMGLGVHLGRSLDPLLHFGYVQGTYTYTFVEHVAGIHQNRANGDLELGYAVSRVVTLRAFASWQKTYGGLDWFYDDTPANHPFHDQAAKANWSRAGGGVVVDVSPTLSLLLNYGTVLQGSNTHASQEFSIGGAWNFGGQRARLPSALH